MYKVVIADDEKIIRLGLKNIVDWNALGFEVVELFADGQEVIEYLDFVMPDVILTDIKMNHVSGMDVAKYVYENELPCKVVLLSGFQEFEYAVKGIQYGVVDYLTKPTEVEKLEDTFSKIRAELEQQKSRREKQQAEKEQMEEARSFLEEHFFSDLVMGVVDSEEYIKSRIGILYPGVDPSESSCLLADLYLDNFQDFMENVWKYSYDQFEVNINNFLKIYGGDYSFHIVFKSGNLLEVVGIYTGHPGEKKENQEKKAVENLVEELEKSFGFSAHYTIRRTYENIFDIIKLKEDAGEIKSEDGAEFSEEHILEQKKLVMSNITMGNIVTAQKIFNNILDELGGVPSVKRHNIIIHILSTMNTVVREVNEKLSESLQPYFNYSAILTMEKKTEIQDYCDRIFDRIRLAEEKKEYYDTDSLVNKAKAFIQDNIYKDISQEEVANQLFISPSYLSRLFRKQTGESFIQFVTRIKMEKAIELLKDLQYKTYHVSEMLGYKTPRYFSRLFRAQTGMNPSEYRSKVLHVGGEFDED